MNRVLNPVNKECLVCKKMMIEVRKDRKYCSSICTRKASHYISHKNCLSCGCEMKNIHGHQKYCTQECYFKSKPTYEERCKNDHNHIALSNAQSRKQTARIKLFLRDYKLVKGCLDCGYKDHHAALQFDHVRGEKTKNVCHTKSIDSAKKEIEKCEVVCANCHHIRSFKRLEDKGKTI